MARLDAAANPSPGNRLRLARAQAHLKQVEARRP
jgi:hypothetical protein